MSTDCLHRLVQQQITFCTQELLVNRLSITFRNLLSRHIESLQWNENEDHVWLQINLRDFPVRRNERILGHSNYNNEFVIDVFNAFCFVWDTLYFTTWLKHLNVNRPIAFEKLKLNAIKEIHWMVKTKEYNYKMRMQSVPLLSLMPHFCSDVG